ncbi:MAG: aminopeptidase N [Campylobacterota bacterium]|nr:aminopeptidase N [Campylobacterota bacterium]
MTDTKITYLKDYIPSAFEIIQCDLEFDIYDKKTVVTSILHVNSKEVHTPSLTLLGEKLQLDSLFVNDIELKHNDYDVNDTKLTLKNLEFPSVIKIVTTILPHENTELEGLYLSGGIFCTQNEPEGFRRITYFLDRPDVMTRFTTKVIADKKAFPVLLSNGNRGEAGELEDNRHFAIWEDPFLKPSYLFALVAGDLGVVNDSFITCSSRKIELNIYCDKGNESKCTHAMQALKDSMKWDEEVYGREYDLEIYNIVAVDSFNMGAMENKGLNVFNSVYVLANTDTATDQNFLGIQSVIAHEYFHNWTGNRITCRDWFQLTLKEGLTVFRDQSFSADMNSKVVQRIDDVKSLRERQFVEDAGPTAHSIKPNSYMEINNFYTATVYEKGAEVIRMFHTLLGEKAYRSAMDLYFKTFDGQAVRTEDFFWAMQENTVLDLKQFKLWYSQMRTPELHVDKIYDAQMKQLKITCKQIIPNDVDGNAQKAYMYPLQIALLNKDGEKIELHVDSQSLIKRNILLITQEEEIFVFNNVENDCHLSFNRNYSAPIKLHVNGVDNTFLMQYDDDGFIRYEAAQEEAVNTIFKIINNKEIDKKFIEAFRSILKDSSIDLLFKAQLLEIPTLSTLMQEQSPIDVPILQSAKESLILTLASTCKIQMLALYNELHEPKNSNLDATSMGKRALKNRVLSYLMRLENSEVMTLCQMQYYDSVTMTDRFVALDLLENFAPEHSILALEDFYTKYKNDTLTMNKYFAILSSSQRNGTLDRVLALQNDACFDIKVPNLVRSLFGVFARNHLHFHAKDGHGYELIADKIIELDSINPAIASGLSGAFKSYKKMNSSNQKLMKQSLEKIIAVPSLSKNVYEIVEKILKQ